MNHTFIRNSILSLLFLSLVVLIQLHHYVSICLWILLTSFLFFIMDEKAKSFIGSILLFGFGFFLYLHTNTHYVNNIESAELHIFLKRLSLLLIVIPFFILSASKKFPLTLYNQKPKWNESISFPFIWLGFHHVKMKYFFIIALVINVLSFLPFILQKEPGFLKSIFLVAIIFSFTNAILEEVIWRGILLSRFSSIVGEKWAVVITSLGFGLQHYSLGFSWITSIVFSIGGFYYAGIVVKSKSLLLSILWHILFNLLMVFSGLILNS